MLRNQFVQTSSIINRLRSVMVAIALFIIIFFIALYLSSQGLFQNLQLLNKDNNLLNLSSQALESLNAPELSLPDNVSKINLTELRYRFNENMKVSEKLVEESVKKSSETDQVKSLLIKVQDALSHFRSSNEITFRHLEELKQVGHNTNKEEIAADILASGQYLIDAKELLRKSQIIIKNRNDKIFNTIYKNRFKPLLVAVLLSTLFFTFVLTFGLSISRKIGKSISNLLLATKKVTEGKLDYQATILQHDEIGLLTDAFNRMTLNLKKGQDELSLAIGRTNRLQSITASFSEALTPEQVFDVIFEQAFHSLKAILGSVIMLSEDKNYLIIKRTLGMDEKTYEEWKTFSIHLDIPLVESLRFGRPLFLNSIEIKKYQDVDQDFRDGQFLQHAYLPMVIGSEALGVITFSFDREEEFDQNEKDFMIALARQCGQAIHRSQLYDDAKKAIEARDEFLSIASHELRTPLTPLKLQLQGLERHIKRGTFNQLSSEKVISIIQTSDRQINRLSTLIDDLLDVSRITTGRLNLNREICSLKEIIDEVINQYSLQLKTALSNIKVSVEEDVQGNWDKVRIEQVIINLLTNAAKYAPNKPIHVKIYSEDNHAVIEVKDEGPGIAPEDQERIFKRFERVISKNNVGGLGLGLYISKQIVDAHKGTISVKSALGEGAVFRVVLPKELA